MKIIKYNRCDRINHGTEEQPQIEEILSPVEIRCNEDVLEANEEIAKKEAHNGKYTIVDELEGEE